MQGSPSEAVTRPIDPLSADALAMLEGIRGSAVVLDAQGVIVATNRAWSRFAAENGADFDDGGVGQNYLEVCDGVSPDHAAAADAARQVADRIRAALRGDDEVHATIVEYACHAPGVSRWYGCRVHRIAAPAQPVRVLVIHEDLSSARDATASLQRAQTRFAGAFERAEVGIVLTDPHGRILHANARFCDIAGREPGEIMQLDVDDLTSPLDRPADRLMRRRLYQGTQRSYTLDKRYVRKDGSLRWVCVTASPITGLDGEIDSIVAIVDDVHERKLTQLALEALNTEKTDEDLLRTVTAALVDLLGVDHGFVVLGDGTGRRPFRVQALSSRQGASIGPAPMLSDEFLERVACQGEGEPVMRRHAPAADPATARTPGVGTSLAVPLWAAGRRLLGSLVVLSSRAIGDAPAALRLLGLCAGRVGAEIEAGWERQMFRDLFNDNPNAVLMTDPAGTIAAASTATWSMLGVDPASLEGVPIWDFFPRPLRAGMRERVAAAMGQGGARLVLQPADGMYLVHPQKGSIPVEVHFSQLVAPDGPRLVCHVQDVTDRLEALGAHERAQLQLEARVAERTRDLEAARMALALKEEESRSVLENMVDCVIGIDARGTVQSANGAIARLLGYRPDEVIGCNVSMLMGEPHRRAHDGYLARYAATGIGRIIGVGRTVSALRKDGRSIELDLSVSTYVVRGQRRYTGILRDVSERARLITSLQSAVEAAEQASRAKSAFLAAMSHEIRTPMNGVLGMIEVLQRSPLQPSQGDMVAVIQESAVALLQVVDDVLDFSKIEAGQLHLAPEPTSVPLVVEAACRALVQIAADKRVLLHLYIDPALSPAVMLDGHRLRQILLNLVGNAIKFTGTEERQGLVSVRAVGLDIQDARVRFRISVEDDGIGMSDETLARLFSPFTQGDMSTTRRFGGTGLGLSISKRLLDLMGGTVVVQSRPGAGSRFDIDLEVDVAGDAPVAADAPWRLPGVRCVVIGQSEAEAQERASYLRADGAVVVGQLSVVQLLEGDVRSIDFMEGVLVVDVSPQELRSVALAAQFTPGHRRGTVVIDRRKVSGPHLVSPGNVVVGGMALRRAQLLQAVAMAAGRQHELSPDGSQDLPMPPADQAPGLADLPILIAEDNEVNREVLLRQIGLFGCRADVAITGEQALTLWRTRAYALVLTDLHMPGMDGYQLCQAIRDEEQRSARPRVPIIAITANAIKGEAAQCLAIGMDDYLTKPVELRRLERVVQRWVRRDAVAPPPGPSVARAPDAGPVAVDLDALRALVGDDAGLIDRILVEFLSDCEDLGVGLVRELRGGDPDRARRTAHQLKSSARTVGAHALAAVCERIERGEGDAGRWLGELEVVLAAVIRFLGATR